MKIIIKNGRILDPQNGVDGVGDIAIDDRMITGIRMHDAGRGKGPAAREADSGEVTVIDATGRVVMPGLIDMHVHLREPGYEYKETIRSGTLAAVRGGFTSVCCMPNTKPVNDNETVTEFILRKAFAEGSCYVYPVGAITKGQKGAELAEMGMMRDAGCVAFSDDGVAVMNSLVMRRALEYSKAFGVPLIAHAEDMTLAAGGVMNEGELSATLGLRGIPAEAELIMILRDIELAALTGGRLHIAHVSTEAGVGAIREAKTRGIAVTAETCPHYFTLTEDAVLGYNANAKVNPPLRRENDREAIRQGLADGTIDVIATDHAPHHRDEKLCEFDRAASGIAGIETALSLGLGLVRDGVLDLETLVMKMAVNPSAILGIGKGTLAEGVDADVVIVDTEKEYVVDPERFISMGRNTPFAGMTLKGVPVATICKGKVYEHE